VRNLRIVNFREKKHYLSLILLFLHQFSLKRQHLHKLILHLHQLLAFIMLIQITPVLRILKIQIKLVQEMLFPLTILGMLIICKNHKILTITVVITGWLKVAMKPSTKISYWRTLTQFLYLQITQIIQMRSAQIISVKSIWTIKKQRGEEQMELLEQQFVCRFLDIL